MIWLRWILDKLYTLALIALLVVAASAVPLALGAVMYLVFRNAYGW